jgi:hypothetical protein
MNGAFQFLVVVLAAVALPIPANAQPSVKIVTVCEVLAGLPDYGNSIVAVVGRLDVVGGIIDRYQYVSQDHCEQPLATQGFVWPSKILIWPYRQKDLPDPPTLRPALDHELLFEKLSAVLKTTTLGTRREFSHIDEDGNPVEMTVQNQGVVVYGHTFTSPDVTTQPCKGDACKGFTGKAPLVIVVDSKNIRTLNDDGSFYRSTYH